MARSKTTTKKAAAKDEQVDADTEAADIDDAIEEPDLEEIDDEGADVDAADDSWSESDDDDDEDEKTSEGESGEQAEDLDELETEELEMLTEDELAETLVVDEAAELRAIRRAELAMSGETGSERGDGEFLCQGCFLVLSTSQLQDKRRKLCVDCAG